MSDPLDIPSAPHRAVWVFSVDKSAVDPTASAENGAPPALIEALGLTGEIDPRKVEFFDLGTLSEYGFSRYLIDANGLDEEAVNARSGELDAMSGPVLLVFKDALADGEHRFAPRPPLTFVARFDEGISLPPVTGIESESAVGTLPQGKPPKSPARVSGMVAAFVLGFLALFVIAFVWIAG